MKTYCETCGKESFMTRGEAERALKSMMRRRKSSGSVYRCSYCNTYHVTSLSYTEGRNRWRGKSPRKNGTIVRDNGTMQKILSHEKLEKMGQWDNENPILSQTLSHEQLTDI